jgi:hypothetical protein
MFRSPASERRLSVILQKVTDEYQRRICSLRLAPSVLIDLAYDEARRLNNNYIGTEHLLLGLIREGEGLAGRVLADVGATLEKTREQIVILQASQPKTGGQRRKLRPGGAVRFYCRGVTAHGAGVAGVDARFGGGICPYASWRSRDGRGDGNTARRLGRSEGGGRAKGVEVSADAAAYSELRRVFDAKDRHGYRELLEVGETLRVFLVKDSTRAKLLSVPDGERATGRYVRILSGEYEGRAGWVAPEAWEQTGPDKAPFPPES